MNRYQSYHVAHHLGSINSSFPYHPTIAIMLVPNSMHNQSQLKLDDFCDIEYSMALSLYDKFYFHLKNELTQLKIVNAQFPSYINLHSMDILSRNQV